MSFRESYREPPDAQAIARDLTSAAHSMKIVGHRGARGSCKQDSRCDIDADYIRVPVGPGSVHVERYGHGGPAIVLLHGFGTSTFLWREIGPAIAKRKHTAFAIDLLGYGESDRPFDADFGVAAQAEYVDRAMAGLRVARATLVGVDLGGSVALRLAAARPERVQRLVLVNPVAFDELPGDDVRSVQRGTARFAVRVARGMLGAAPLLAPLLEGSVSDPRHMPPRLLARYLAPYVGSDGVSHLLSLARSLKKEDVEELPLSELHTPTLVVWGDSDRWLDAAHADRIAAAMPVCRLVRLPNIGRLVPEEDPEQLVTLLMNFVEGKSVA